MSTNGVSQPQQPQTAAAPATAIVSTAHAPSGAVALAPKSIDDAIRLANMASEANLYGVKSPQEAFIRMATGMEVGLSPWQSLRSVYVIENRPSMSADLMVALCLRARDICESFQLIESTDAVATYETKRVGQAVKRMSWTIDQSRQAGLLTKANWKNYPAAMLRARCSAALARAVYPDLTLGLYTPDEITDGSAPTGPVTTMTANGEVIAEGSSPATTAPARDFQAEMQALIDQVAAVRNAEEKKALRTAIDKSDLPQDMLLKVQEAYTARFIARRAQQPAGAAAQPQGTAGSAPAAAAPPPATTTQPAPVDAPAAESAPAKPMREIGEEG